MASVSIDRRKLLSFIIASVLLLVACVSASSEEHSVCKDIRYLLGQSKEQFASIRGGPDSQFGDFETTFTLPDVWHCAILEDAEKQSYRCVWRYPLGDEQALKAFQHLVVDVKECIGDIASEQADQAVNHPDIYQSRYYRLPTGTLNINLKNKSDLESTLISMRIDGPVAKK